MKTSFVLLLTDRCLEIFLEDFFKLQCFIQSTRSWIWLFFCHWWNNSHYSRLDWWAFINNSNFILFFEIIQILLTLQEGGLLRPPWNKNGICSTIFGPIEPKKFDFSYKPMRMLIILGAWNGGDKFWILKFIFLPFLRLKWLKLISYPKLIVPDDYQQIWLHFEWFLAPFHRSDENWLLW